MWLPYVEETAMSEVARKLDFDVNYERRECLTRESKATDRVTANATRKARIEVGLSTYRTPLER